MPNFFLVHQASPVRIGINCAGRCHYVGSRTTCHGDYHLQRTGASACIAYKARYWFTVSVCLSVYPSHCGTVSKRYR